MGEKGKGLRSTDWQLRSSHRVAEYSARSAVDATVITVHGARWVWELLGDHLISYINVQPQCHPDQLVCASKNCSTQSLLRFFQKNKSEASAFGSRETNLPGKSPNPQQTSKG